MFLFAKATLLFLLPLLLDPHLGSASLTGVAPGANAATAKNKAGNDPSYIGSEDFEMLMLDTHNKWRREHGVKDVSWDPRLAEYAETVTRKCEWRHSNGPYGENLSAGYKTAELSVDTWGNERELYHSLSDYEKENPPPKSGHFTQLVWASSSKIGCARRKCAGIIGEEFESWFVACEYAERGNVDGTYTKNVFKPTRRSPERRLGIQKDDE